MPWLLPVPSRPPPRAAVGLMGGTGQAGLCRPPHCGCPGSGGHTPWAGLQTGSAHPGHARSLPPLRPDPALPLAWAPGVHPPASHASERPLLRRV